jgi:hypothetical protein
MKATILPRIEILEMFCREYRSYILVTYNPKKKLRLTYVCIKFIQCNPKKDDEIAKACSTNG